jgi:glycosyltransferase involved in cell wall biosynthesis
VDVPVPFRIQNASDLCLVDRSDCVRLALERLHEDHYFDVIEFESGEGLGFRSVQAKNAGLGFEDVLLAVRLDTVSQLHREQNERWLGSLEELQTDFCERYAFEQADVQVCPCPALVECAKSLGWRFLNNGEGAPGTAYRVTMLRLLYDEFNANVCVKMRDLCAVNDVPQTQTNGPLVTVAVAHHNLGLYLPEALSALAEQTYAKMEVLVIDDGSIDAHAIESFEAMRARYPRFRFVVQPNAGIGATRNRGLWEARGEYFIPVDADNIARPEMVERMVTAIVRNPHLHAMTCYCLAFRSTEELSREEYLYAHRPTGGPHVLASIRNVYGDANAIFHTASLRAVGGYETDRDSSFEDWEAFVKLVNRGYRIGVVPDHLFYYRHRDAGFSRVTNAYRNHQRVLRQFFQLESLPTTERIALWTALIGLHRQAQELAARQAGVRYRLADWLHGLLMRAPLAARGLKWLLRSGWGAWEYCAGKGKRGSMRSSATHLSPTHDMV